MQNNYNMDVHIHYHNKHITHNNILYLEVPGLKYKLQIYKNHHPIISILKPGIIKIIFYNKLYQYIQTTSNSILYIKKKNIIHIVCM
jgi:F0F1-type ATP synthase epsilon subunit